MPTNPVVEMNQDQPTTTTDEVWRQFHIRLRQFVRSRISSTADTDDVMQALFLQIHVKLESLRNTERLESWVFQIARNIIVDHYRRKAKHHHDSQTVESSVEPAAPDADNLNCEIASCVQILIDQLPSGQRRALSMYELQGVAQNDIAKQESISLSGAKSRIQRGRKSLEAMLRACCKFQLDGRGNPVEYEPRSQNCCNNECK